MSSRDPGRIFVRYSKPLIAGQLVTCIFEYTVGKVGIAENGELRIGLPNVGWSKPLVPQYYFWSEYARGKDRIYTEYDRVNTTVYVESHSKAFPLLESESRFRKPWSYPPSWLRDYDRYWITVTIEDDYLNPGDKVIVTYGDPSQLPLTAQIQGFPEKEVHFLAFVDTDGNGQFEEMAGSPWPASVHSGPFTRMDVITPSIVTPDKIPIIRIAYTDKMKARPEPLPMIKTIEMSMGETGGLKREIQVERVTDSFEVEMPELLSRKEKSTVHVCAREGSYNVGARSNPTVMRSKGLKLFWGDFHGQSQYHGWNPHERRGISCNTPEECYNYARSIAGLDFCAITDSASIAKDVWQEIVETALRMNEPGRFVAFQGSEVGDNVHGHRNLIFAKDSPEPGIVTAGIGQRADFLRELETPEIQKRYTGRKDVILIPHHTKMWLDWDCYSPKLEPVLEIYSIWGSGEKAGTHLWNIREVTGGAQEAWTRGYKIGVIAGSDTHAGMPGRSIAKSDRDDFLPYPAGYAGVWARELTRVSIFEALRARRCYGTTGVRIILETFIGEYPMGTEIAWPNKRKSREFRVNVWGTAELDTVIVVKNNLDVYAYRTKSERAQLSWEDRSEARPGDYYYVRIKQRDGNYAWSSPVWLNC